MSESKFTPGPWDFDGEPCDSEAAIELGLDGYEIFRRDERGDVADPIGTALEEDDARLMAAAPQLYDALTYALPIVEKYAHTQGDNAAFHAEITAPIRAALAKASPEQST